MKFFFLVTSFFLLLHDSTFSQLSIEDHLAMENLNSPLVYGDNILFASTTKEKWDGKSFSSLAISDLDGRNKTNLTEGEYDYDPKWSKDGKWISFISYRNHLQQIYVIPKKGGEPKIASDAQNYLSNYQWLDEETIAYVDDEPRDSTLLAMEKMNGGGYKVGTEFFKNALWSYNINSCKKKKITDGSYRIINFDISTDGKKIAVLAAINYDAYESITNSWVEVIDIATKSSTFRYNEANSLNHVVFSPSGKQLAFAGSTEGFASNDGLFIANLETGHVENMTYEFDPTIEKIQWIDEKSICFSTPGDGYTGIYSLDTNGNITSILNPYWVIYDFQINDNEIFFTASRNPRTKQLYKVKIGQNPGKAIQLTNINSELVPKIKTTSRLLNYESIDGVEIQGIVTYPPNYESSVKYPLMVIPHGGPDAVVLDDFNWMGQYFADNGYIVFQPNYRGSIRYGRDFYAGNRNSFGKNDFEDIMAGVDELIKLNIADENKLIIGGWSYGGYMANWAITQTNRFKAAISVAGVSNLVSLYGQHEFSNRKIGMWEYKALPIDSIENYRRSSPIFFVKNATTPLLILHGSNDTRSPTLQAWEMYRAMKDAKKEVEMILYPNAGHSIGNPVQFKSVLTNWLDWANQSLNRK
ncbi:MULTISPECIES: S9 family peptidase [Flavobacteriaceae]|uniref:S9 family peptidase n=1 Tax=Flavobacteriaceae TaxID=49546 RepID=UPI00234BCA0F|nr:S9 family peptidase [Muricauda sp. SP22]MDC6361321.1 S9 family peptidase [Muricauda sp. SP22]